MSIKPKDKQVQDLENKIEILLHQRDCTINPTEEIHLRRQIENLAYKYHQVTGNWYRREA